MRQQSLFDCITHKHKIRSDSNKQFDSLLGLIQSESDILFCGIFSVGTVLRNIGDILHRYARCTCVLINNDGLQFVSEGKQGKTKYTIDIHLSSRDACMYRYTLTEPCHINFDTLPFYALTNQLKRKDCVLLYAQSDNMMGIAVGSMRDTKHMKHGSLYFRTTQSSDRVPIPLNKIRGVGASSQLLQRIVRELRSLTKFAVVNGNMSYVQICSDDRCTEHRSDNIFGTPNGLATSTSVDLCASMMVKLLKFAQYNTDIEFICQIEKPLLVQGKLKRAKFSNCRLFMHN